MRPELMVLTARVSSNSLYRSYLYNEFIKLNHQLDLDLAHCLFIEQARRMHVELR